MYCVCGWRRSRMCICIPCLMSRAYLLSSLACCCSFWHNFTFPLAAKGFPWFCGPQYLNRGTVPDVLRKFWCTSDMPQLVAQLVIQALHQSTCNSTTSVLNLKRPVRACMPRLLSSDRGQIVCTPRDSVPLRHVTVQQRMHVHQLPPFLMSCSTG